MARNVFTQQRLARMASIFDVLIDKDMHWLHSSINAGFARIYLYEISPPLNRTAPKIIHETVLFSHESDESFSEKMKRFHHALSKAVESSNKSMAVRKKERGDYIYGTKKGLIEEEVNND